MPQLFNDFADQAGYYDLCLLIYHTADYRNSTTIFGTWTNLIQQTHDQVAESRENPQSSQSAPQPMPYEVVSSKIQNIAHRTSLDSFVFPISTLLPDVCRYAASSEQDARVGADPAWPVQLFLSLGVSHDMVTRVLENVFDTQDFGFSGSARWRIVELIVYTVNDWVAETRRRGGASKGSGAIGPSVGELLVRCEGVMPPPGQGVNPGGSELADIRRVLRQVRREVQGMVERIPVGSMRFM